MLFAGSTLRLTTPARWPRTLIAAPAAGVKTVEFEFFAAAAALSVSCCCTRNPAIPLLGGREGQDVLAVPTVHLGGLHQTQPVAHVPTPAPAHQPALPMCGPPLLSSEPGPPPEGLVAMGAAGRGSSSEIHRATLWTKRVPILALTLTITPPFAPAPCITLPFARGGGARGRGAHTGCGRPKPCRVGLGRRWGVPDSLSAGSPLGTHPSPHVLRGAPPLHPVGGPREEAGRQLGVH